MICGRWMPPGARGPRPPECSARAGTPWRSTPTWRTCRPPRRCPGGEAGPRSGGYEEWVAGVLEADPGTPRKRRRTAWRIYDRLVAERGYAGSCSAARRLVREPRLARAAAGGEGCLELEWASGTRRVDFGNFRAVAGGRALGPRLLVATLPHSNGRQCAALMSQRSGGRARSPSPSWRSVRGSAPRSRWSTWRATSRRRGPAARPRSARRRSGAARRQRPRPSTATTRPTGRGAVRTPSRTYSVHLFVRAPPSEKPPLWSSLTIQRPSPVIFMTI